MKIALTGFMGAGKSSVARALTDQFGIAYQETDRRVLENTGRETVQELFTVSGEGTFREEEYRALKELVADEVPVISCGGGVGASEENIGILRDGGYQIVLLDSPFSLLVNRVSGDKERPLFTDPVQAERLFQERLPYYRDLADLIFPVGDRPVAFFAQVLAQLFGVGDPKISLYCVIGDPVSHSLSPQVHNGFFQESRTDQEMYYFAWRVKESALIAIQSLLRGHRLSGVSVTMPFKERVIDFVDRLTPAGEKIGAVNTLFVRNGEIYGDNTDWIGITDSLLAETELNGRSAVVLGAGGTARAAVYGLLQKGANVTVVNRTYDRAKKLAAEFSVDVGELQDVDLLNRSDILVHTTSVGMFPDLEQSLLSEDCFRTDQVVLDLVYKPRKTALLKLAEKRGAIGVDGEEVFFKQAAAQSRIFVHGVEPENFFASSLGQG